MIKGIVAESIVESDRINIEVYDVDIDPVDQVFIELTKENGVMEAINENN